MDLLLKRTIDFAIERKECLWIIPFRMEHTSSYICWSVFRSSALVIENNRTDTVALAIELCLIEDPILRNASWNIKKQVVKEH